MTQIAHRQLMLSAIVFICLIFFSIQLTLNYRAMVTADEYWVLSSVYNKYLAQIPYRDFSPYKTVLGYYLLAPPMLLKSDIVTMMIQLRNYISVINVACLLFASLWLTRFYAPKFILMSLMLLCLTSSLLTCTNDIRVDMLSYWLCLMSVLLLLDKRTLLAAVILGVGFCISQKALWHGLACNFALIVIWYFYQRDRTFFTSIVKFNVGFIGVIAIYIFLWSLISNFHSVIDSMFIQPAIVYKIDVYTSDTKALFNSILARDTLYFSLWVMCLIGLFIKVNPVQQQRHVFVMAYAFSCLLQLIMYKQPFPYYTVAAIPPLLLLYTDFFAWLAEAGKNKITLLVNQREFILITILVALLLGSLRISLYYLPNDYTCMYIIALSVGAYVICAMNKRIRAQYCLQALICLMIVYLGMVVEIINLYETFRLEGFRYQQLAMRVASLILQDDDMYVAGIEILYDKKQPISGNTGVEQSIKYLQHPNPVLAPTLISSLDLSPDVTLEKIMQKIDAAPVKVFLDMHHIDKLPRLIDHLRKNYEHMWGNIFIYSPTIAAQHQLFQLKFTGNYQLESVNPIYLDGKSTQPNSIIHLTKAAHSSFANQSFRLKFIPDNLPPLPDEYAKYIGVRLFSECSVVYVKGKRHCIYLY